MSLLLAPILLATLAFAQTSNNQQLLADLQRRVGADAWQSVVSSPDGEAFLNELGNSEEWLRELLDSGPVRRANLVLPFLHSLWLMDPELAQRPVDREMATACALAMGMKDYNDDWMTARYIYYRDSYEAGLLNACYKTLATWERRYLARGCQWTNFADVAALEFLRERISWPRADYVGASWQAPYRGFNSLADSVQGSAYYMPFQGSFSCGPEMAINVGGVCGALSNLGASAAMANGIPATTMGEPGHCAYAVKVNDSTWKPAYSLSWKRSMHISFFENSWPALMLTEAHFSNPDLVRKASDLARKARALEADGKIGRANAQWERALKAYGLHYELWLEWASFGERTEQGNKWWQDYHDALLKGLGAHEEPTWNILSKRVYPKLVEEMDEGEKRRFFLAWVRGLHAWGGGRWNVEGAWEWMFSKLDAKSQARFSQSITSQLIDSPDFGPPWVAWLLSRHDPDSKEWAQALRGILRAAGSDKSGDGSKAALKQLARTVLPEAAARGDVSAFQSIGELTASLSESLPMTGIEPFKGDLMSAGGLLMVSGKGNRWDSPEKHWGVLGEHGGRCHTDNGASSIAVRLEHHTELTGIVIQNIDRGNLWRAGGSRIEISSDGESWEQIASLEGTKGIYRLDFEGKKHRGLWVRMVKDSNCLHVRRFLVYGRRRS